MEGYDYTRQVLFDWLHCFTICVQYSFLHLNTPNKAIYLYFFVRQQNR